MKDNVFDRINDWIRDTESSIVNFLSVFAPWMAPIVPAYMTFRHAYDVLNFPFLVALAAAVLVEILGFSAVSTFLAFWFHNKKNTAEVKRAPIEVVVFAFLFYLILIVATNVLLDSFPGERWAEILVRALFTLQTIPAALIVAVRTQHRDLLSEISKEKERKLSEKQKETYRKPSESLDTGTESFRKLSENLPRHWRTLRPTLSEADLANLANLTPDDVKRTAVQYQVSTHTVTNWRANARAELGIQD